MPRFSSLRTMISNLQKTHHGDRKAKQNRHTQRRRKLAAELLEQRQLLVADYSLDYSLILTEPSGYPMGSESIAVGTNLYFAEADAVHGIELRKLDTVTGVKSLVADINPGIGDSSAAYFVAVGDKLFFNAYDPTNGQELRWIDTSLAQPDIHTIDIYPGWESSRSGEFGSAVSGSKLYFSAYNPSGNPLLWVDASLDEPIQQTVSTGFSSINKVLAADDHLYFVGMHQSSYKMGWFDTTVQSPAIVVADLGIGPFSQTNYFDTDSLFLAGSKLYYTATLSGVAGNLHWIDPADSSHTVHKVSTSDSIAISQVRDFVVVGDLIYFTARDSVRGLELHWINFATSPSEAHGIDINNGVGDSWASQGGYSTVGSRLYFSAIDETNVRELRWIDTAISPSVMTVLDLNLSRAGDNLNLFGTLGNRLYFSAYIDGVTTLRWIDTSIASPQIHSTDITPYGIAYGRGATQVDNKLYLIAADFSGPWYWSLYSIENSGNGVILTPYEYNSLGGYSNYEYAIHHTAIIGSRLYFLSYSIEANGYHIQWIDSTEDNPIVHDTGIRYIAHDEAMGFVAVGTKIYYFEQNQFGRRLNWIDTALAQPVETYIVVGPNDPIGTNTFFTTVAGTKLYFTYKSLDGNIELAWIDTTQANPTVNNTAYPSGTTKVNAKDFTLVGNRLYFVATDPTNGTELRWIDTLVDPSLVNTVDATTGSDGSFDFSKVTEFKLIGDKLHFITNDNRLRWIDPLAANPVATAIEINSDGSPLEIKEFCEVGDKIYAKGADATGKDVLAWFYTDDANPAPVLIADLWYTNIGTLMPLGDVLYTSLWTQNSNRPLVRIDTTATPSEVQQVDDDSYHDVPGSGGFIAVNDYLYFFATERRFGNELRRVSNTSDTVETFEVYATYGPGIGPFSKIIHLNGKVYFSAVQGAFGSELYVVQNSQAGHSPNDIQLTNTSINENQASGTIVGTLSTIDPDVADSFTYSLVSGLGSTDNALFSVDGNTLKNNSAFNFEQRSSYTIRVRTTDQTNRSFEKSFIIRVIDVDEFNVTLPTDTNATTNILPENASAGTNVGITANASDADGTTNTITYSLIDSAGGLFAVHPTTGVITLVAANLDYETKASYNIAVQARSSDGSSATSNFTIALTDVDEFDVTGPVDTNDALDSLAENATAGTPVGITVNAIDVDGTNNFVVYSLIDSADDQFTIDPVTGVIKLATANLDYETKSSYTIAVQADSSDGSKATANFTISITDVDEFDVTTPADTNAAANTLAENATVGALVGITAKATDNDGTNSSITYALTDSANGQFSIDPVTGVVKLALANLDFESKSSFSITVQAKSADGSASTSIFSIIITDVDEFDVTSPADGNNASNSLAENATVGTLAGITAKSTDNDGTNNTITYSLTDSANGRFSINPATGVITLATANLNFESQTSFTITVQAKSSDGSTATSNFTINISNIDEVPTAVADTYEVPADRTLTVNTANGVLVNDIKADQTNPMVQVVAQPTKGTVTLAADGTFIYKPSTNAVADQDDTFTYRIVETDGSVSPPATVTIHLEAKLGSPLHNNTSPMDVSPGTQPGIISTLDMLAIINLLNANRGRSSIPVSEIGATTFYYDVNNDYVVSSLDVLVIINHINWVRRIGGGEAAAIADSSSTTSTTTNSSLFDAALVDLTELPNRKQLKGSL